MTRAFRRRIPENSKVEVVTASQKGCRSDRTRSSMFAPSWRASRSPTGSAGPRGTTVSVATWACGVVESNGNGRKSAAANR
jgi:hypothetical protein